MRWSSLHDWHPIFPPVNTNFLHTSAQWLLSVSCNNKCIAVTYRGPPESPKSTISGITPILTYPSPVPTILAWKYISNPSLLLGVISTGNSLWEHLHQVCSISARHFANTFSIVNKDWKLFLHMSEMLHHKNMLKKIKNEFPCWTTLQNSLCQSRTCAGDQLPCTTPSTQLHLPPTPEFSDVNGHCCFCAIIFVLGFECFAGTTVDKPSSLAPVASFVYATLECIHLILV